MGNIPPLIQILIIATGILLFAFGYLLGVYRTSFTKPKNKPVAPVADPNLGKEETIAIPGHMRLAFLVGICNDRKITLEKTQKEETEILRDLYWVGRQHENKFFLDLFNNAIDNWEKPTATKNKPHKLKLKIENLSKAENHISLFYPLQTYTSANYGNNRFVNIFLEWLAEPLTQDNRPIEYGGLLYELLSGKKYLLKIANYHELLPHIQLLMVRQYFKDDQSHYSDWQMQQTDDPCEPIVVDKRTHMIIILKPSATIEPIFELIEKTTK